MADTKLSSLTLLAQGDLVPADDLVYVADISAGTAGSKNMTAAGLVLGVLEDAGTLTQRSLTALSNAQLRALAATPVEVVAAPGSGKLVQVVGWRVRLIFVTTAFDDAAADGNLDLRYANGQSIHVMEADGLIDAAATTQGLAGDKATMLTLAESALENQAIQISNDGAEFTISGGGDSTAEVEVFYRVLDTNPS